jgi:hypothetical protein
MAGREYLRRYPSRVRTAVLRAAVAPERSWAVYHGRNTHQALDRLFTLCAADARCHAAFLAAGSLAGLDLSCAERVAMPAFPGPI